jgi:hypothetical protein
VTLPNSAAMARLAGRLLVAAAIVIVAMWAAFVYRDLAAMSRASASEEDVRRGRIAADYDLPQISWSAVDARQLSTRDGHLDLVTGDGPYLYQAMASVPIHGASFAHLAFKGRVTRGGITIGLVANGRWLANRSIRDSREFDDLLTAQPRDTPTLTVVVANCNPAGESMANLDDLKLYLIR